MGVLHAELLRGKEIFSFEYEKTWLQSEHAQMLDPDLQLYSGLHYLNDPNKHNFGMFLDSSPDRWGRILMRRREAALARQELRPPTNLVETDYPNWDWIAKMQEPPARVLINSIFNQCRIFDIDLGAKVLR
jgi:serine/threonine-protein kinase HipA